MTDIYERLWAKIDHVGRSPHECWPFMGAHGRGGYGKYWLAGKTWRAHRAAWHSRRFPIPEGLWVLHLCNNPPCCNPDHLYLGTLHDNHADRRRQNRIPRGVHNGRAKLTPTQVKAIRTDPRSKLKIAAAYGIGATQVTRIKDGIQWKHI